MVTRVGVLGIAEGNGHPFSFSAIINGYDERGMSESGWAVIHDYVRRRDASEFGIGNLRVTHAWTQDPETTRKLCAASRIPDIADSPEDMLGKVDAVIVARDDHAVHLPLARPFLEAGLPVFIDKPLSLDPAELAVFRPYLESGQLMSCSGMRYAMELDVPRATLPAYGTIKLARGAAVLAWENYGIHMIDALLGVLASRPVAVTAHRAAHASASVEMDDGSVMLIDALGTTTKVFRVDIFGSAAHSSHEINDNFTMFRRTLWHFAEMVRTGRPAIPPERTLDAMRVLIAGNRSREEGRRVALDELLV